MARFLDEEDFDLSSDEGELDDQVEATSGRTYIMYHGTTRRNAKAILKKGFRQSTDGMLGRGVYLSRDPEKASRYPVEHPQSDKVVIKVRVNVGKVIAITRKRHPLRKTWHDHGYDCAWVPPECGMVRSGLEEDCVWDPKRIKILDVIRSRPAQEEDLSPAAVGAAFAVGALAAVGMAVLSLLSDSKR